ncbi:transglycosylase domain-containing protein [Sphingomonas sp. GlSt437]|uniref:transglycosylase domain-containing protein n=2 Tax=Pseudomonadota TaxID=1224 RepID=UPI003A8B6F76
MRGFPFDDEPLELTNGMPPPDARRAPAWRDTAPTEPPPPPGSYTTNLPVAYRPRRFRWVMRGLAALLVLFFIGVGWLALTAPLSKSLQPPAPPSVTLLASDGTPIARRGAIIGKPVDAAKLPKHVTDAFIAIEDRRFYHHWGVDPWGIGRAMFRNVAAGGLREGGSTITQQLAKNAFLDSDRTAGRKIREVMIAFWLEAWLSKNDILSRYLSNVYFGDNVYGLSAAAKHYFSTTPAKLTIGQAAMLAGLVKAPSRLAPTGNLAGAQARQMVVVNAMAEDKLIDRATAAAVKPARLHPDQVADLPDGSYFADWVLPAARDRAGAISAASTVTTTLDARLQRAAERSVRHIGLGKAQVAMVVMHPDGRVVAMVGGKNYDDSPFNRATQARRQPGSTFKLFVYYAALKSRMTPDSTIEDKPIKIGQWEPRNSSGRYRGQITLRQAFAISSNVAAARLTQQVGVDKVIKAARDLGISTPIPNEATIALGTATGSLLELTAAYAAVAGGDYPVGARGLADAPDKSWLQQWASGPHRMDERVRSQMMDLLAASIATGTGRQAALSIPSYGKTGTTQDSRDALFIGFAGDLVCGVWVGNDDNSPSAGLSGGGIPARLWRDFMQQALNVGPRAAPAPDIFSTISNAMDALVDPDAASPDAGNATMPEEDAPAPEVVGNINGLGLNLSIGRDGSIKVRRDRPRRDTPADRAPDPRDRPRPPPEGEGR